MRVNNGSGGLSLESEFWVCLTTPIQLNKRNKAVEECNWLTINVMYMNVHLSWFIGAESRQLQRNMRRRNEMYARMHLTETMPLSNIWLSGVLSQAQFCWSLRTQWHHRYIHCHVTMRSWDDLLNERRKISTSYLTVQYRLLLIQGT